jgi:hypothetical protein
MATSAGGGTPPGAAVRGAGGGVAAAAAHVRGPPAGGCRTTLPLTAPTSAGAACGGVAAAAAALRWRRRRRCAARRVVLLLPAGVAAPAGCTGTAFAVSPICRHATPAGATRQRSANRKNAAACCAAAASASRSAEAEAGSLCQRRAALPPPRSARATPRSAERAVAAALTASRSSWTPAARAQRCFPMAAAAAANTYQQRAHRRPPRMGAAHSHPLTRTACLRAPARPDAPPAKLPHCCATALQHRGTPAPAAPRPTRVCRQRRPCARPRPPRARARAAPTRPAPGAACGEKSQSYNSIIIRFRASVALMLGCQNNAVFGQGTANDRVVYVGDCSPRTTSPTPVCTRGSYTSIRGTLTFEF